MSAQSRLYKYLASGRVSLTSVIQALVVSETLSFRKAAEILTISQSAISGRISALEEAIGFPIFERRRGVRLTPRGRVFLEFVSEAVDLIGRSLAVADSSADARKSTLHIGLQSSFSAGPSGDILKKIGVALPEIRLICREIDNSDFTSCVRRRKLDVAFVPDGTITERLPHDLLDALPLWDEEVIVALSANDPLAARSHLLWRDLLDREFLVRSHGIGPHLMDRALPLVRQTGEPRRIEHLHVGRDTLLTEVVRRRAVALTTEATQGLTLPGLTFRSVGETPLLITFCALWSRQNTNPQLRALLRIIRDLSAAYVRERTRAPS